MQKSCFLKVINLEIKNKEIEGFKKTNCKKMVLDCDIPLMLLEYLSQNFTTHEIDGNGIFLDLKIKTSFLLGFVRSSGSKKSKYEISHILREIAGFEVPDSGQIWLTEKENVFQKLGVTFIYEIFMKSVL